MMTITALQIAFKRFNSCYFNDALPMVTIKYCNSNSYMGLFYHKKDKYGRYVIKINKRYEMSDYATENILIHEMIHLWQAVNNYNDSHGVTFHSKMREINRIGKHKISVKCIETFKVSDDAIQTAKPSYILIYKGKSANYVYKFTNFDKLTEGYNYLVRKTTTSDCANYKAYLASNEIVMNMRSCRCRLWRYSFNDLTVKEIISSHGVKNVTLRITK